MPDVNNKTLAKRAVYDKLNLDGSLTSTQRKVLANNYGLSVGDIKNLEAEIRHYVNPGIPSKSRGKIGGTRGDRTPESSNVDESPTVEIEIGSHKRSTYKDLIQQAEVTLLSRIMSFMKENLIHNEELGKALTNKLVVARIKLLDSTEIDKYSRYLNKIGEIRDKLYDLSEIQKVYPHYDITECNGFHVCKICGEVVSKAYEGKRMDLIDLLKNKVKEVKKLTEIKVPKYLKKRPYLQSHEIPRAIKVQDEYPNKININPKILDRPGDLYSG